MRWVCFLLLAACSRPPEPITLQWTVTGRVLDADGEPVAGARVIAIPVEIDDETPTGADGGFSIDPGVDDARTFLVVAHTGHALSESTSMLDVAEQGREVDLRVGPEPAPVTVVVHGDSGRVYWQTGSPGQGGSLTVTGQVTIADMPPGEVRIVFRSRSGHFEVRDLVAEPGLKVHFQKQTPFLTEGVVVDPDGKPVRGAYVHDFRLPSLRAATDAEGAFGIFGAPPEEHDSFEAVAPGYARTIVPADTNVRIVLTPSIAFKGRVTDAEGRPLIRARVILQPTDDPPVVTATIAHGHFFFDH